MLGFKLVLHHKDVLSMHTIDRYSIFIELKDLKHFISLRLKLVLDQDNIFGIITEVQKLC